MPLSRSSVRSIGRAFFCGSHPFEQSWDARGGPVEGLGDACAVLVQGFEVVTPSVSGEVTPCDHPIELVLYDGVAHRVGDTDSHAHAEHAHAVPKREPNANRSGPDRRPRTLPEPSKLLCWCVSARRSNTSCGLADTSTLRDTCVLLHDGCFLQQLPQPRATAIYRRVGSRDKRPARFPQTATNPRAKQLRTRYNGGPVRQPADPPFPDGRTINDSGVMAMPIPRAGDVRGRIRIGSGGGSG